VGAVYKQPLIYFGRGDALSNEECTAQQLRVVEDGVPYPEHCYLDFSVFEKREVERKAKHLSSVAQSREWIFEIDRKS